MLVGVLHGPNFNVLERRDAAVYGGLSLPELEGRIREWGAELGCDVLCRQTNHEGEYVEFLHAALDNADALVVNPGAWTHYSWAIRDALEPFEGAVIEVHISDIEDREEWRKRSVLEGLTTERVIGQGIDGYRRALELLAERRDG